MAARQVILYFDDQKDALRFALAAGSVMATDGETVAAEERTLIQETQRASRILLDEGVNTGTPAKPAWLRSTINPRRCAAPYTSRINTQSRVSR
jgi:hypothetical protein